MCTPHIQLSKHHGEWQRYKISKCCCDPFNIHKKKLIALICIITKVYLQSQSNVSLENGKKDQSSVKQWHNIWSGFSCTNKTLAHIWCASSRSNNWCCVIAFQFFFFWGTGDPLFNWHFTGICMIFFRHWTQSFFPFSRHWSHTVSRKTFVITRNNAITFFLCTYWMDHNRIYSFCHSIWCLLNWICRVQIYLIWHSMARLAASWFIPMGCIAMSPSPCHWV